MLLAVPALRALAAAEEGALTLAAQPRIGRLLAALGVVAAAIDFDALHLDRLFRKGPIVLDEREPLRAMTILSWFGSGDPGFVANLTALAPRATVAPPHLPGRVTWEHLLETAGGSARNAGSLRATVVVPPPLLDAGQRALARAGWSGAHPLLVVHPGAGGIAKRWAPEAFAAVLETVAAGGRAVLALHQGPADRDAVAALVERLAVPALRLVEPELEALAGVLAGAAAYLGNDSGVSHLAAAVGAPSVVLFRRETLDWRPWAPGVEPLVVSTAAPRAEDVGRVAAAVRARLR